MTAETYYNEVMKPEIKLFHDEVMEKLNTNEEIKKLYCGWKVWFSQIIDEPEILFLGINPGGGEGGDLILEPDGILQYIYDKSPTWHLKNDTLEVFEDLKDIVELANCVKINYYYLATKDSSKENFQEITDFLGREKDNNGLGDRFYQNSQKWTQQLLNIIKPKLIICEGKKAFELMTKYVLGLKIETNNEDVYSIFSDSLKTNILGYNRQHPRGGIVNKVMLKDRIQEFTISREEEHRKILKDLYDTYAPDSREKFINDGPSDWNLYYNSIPNPRILFLVKESRNGYQPSNPNQKTNTKFTANIARWKEIIKNAAFGNIQLNFIDDANLTPTNEDVAIIEVKKINHENINTNPDELKDYARRDKSFLSKQINIINPQVIVCCGTGDCYDIIFEDLNLNEENLIRYGNTSCWDSQNRLVIYFHHPTTFPHYIQTANEKDKEYFKLLSDLLAGDKVKFKLQEIMSN